MQQDNSDQENKKDRKNRLKQFIKQCPQYIIGKKIQFPILDSILHDNATLFPQESIFLPKPRGQEVEIYSNVPLSDLFEIVAFLNNFPMSGPFSAITGTQHICLSTPLTLTAFTKIFVQLECDMQWNIKHLQQAMTRQDTGSSYKFDGESLYLQDRIMFHLLSFYVEEVFRYRQGLFTYTEQPSSKRRKKTKKSLKSIIAEMEVDYEEQIEEDEDDDEARGVEASMEVKTDVRGQMFWDFLYELFQNQVQKGLKLRKRLKSEGEDLEMDLFGSWEMTETEIESARRRLRFIQQLNAKKLKAKYKSSTKFVKVMKRHDYDNGYALKKTEVEMFRRLLRCLTASWPEILRQVVKVPLLSMFLSKEALRTIKDDFVSVEKGGFFGFTQRQKGRLMHSILNGIHNLDSFRTIVEYREELAQELSHDLEDAHKNLSDIVAKDQQSNGEDLTRKKNEARFECKKLLQLNEFTQLWINGVSSLGQDVEKDEILLFSDSVDRLYSFNNNQCQVYMKNEIEQLKDILNNNGVMERELLRNIQRYEIYEVLENEECMQFLSEELKQMKQNHHELEKKDSTLYYDKVFLNEKEFINKKQLDPLRFQTRQAMLDMENKLSVFLMNGKCRWACFKARKNFQNTLEVLTQLTDVKVFLKTFVESIDMIESLKIDHNKLQSSFTQLKDSDLKYLNAVSAKKQVDENTIFQDIRLFQLMEGLEVIKHSSKVKFKLWDYSGEKIKQLWFTYLNLAEDYISLMFLINVLNFIIEEYSYFTMEGDIYFDQELASLAAQLDLEDREKQKQLLKHIPDERLIQIESD